MRPDLEHFGQGLWLSLALHAGLGALLLFVPAWAPAYGDVSWGSEAGGGDGISVGLASSLPSGIPLAAPVIVTEGAIANDSEGFYEPEPEAEVPEPEPEPEAAEEVPETPVPAEEPPPPPAPEPPPPARPVPDETRTPPRPENAIPFGRGGQPDISGGNTAGTGVGLDAGSGAFGDRYGTYVESITRRISQEWLRSTVDSSVRVAPRVYVRFDILRNGSIVNIELERPSGVRSLDLSAQRAVYAANPLPPLPADFRGSRISVRFWFEYVR